MLDGMLPVVVFHVGVAKLIKFKKLMAGAVIQKIVGNVLVLVGIIVVMDVFVLLLSIPTNPHQML